MNLEAVLAGALPGDCSGSGGPERLSYLPKDTEPAKAKGRAGPEPLFAALPASTVFLVPRLLSSGRRVAPAHS